jgi:replicative DNA helicase
MIHDSTANEKAFIGCLLRSPHEFWQCNDIVTADQFQIAHHRDIFTAIRDLSERGRQVTITALQTNLPEEYPDAGPTIAVLMALKESAAEAGSSTDYAPFLAERSARKKFDALADWMKKEARNPDKQAEDLAAETGLRLNAIMSVASTTKPKAIGEIATLVTRQANSAQMGEVTDGISSGVSSLDEILGLILPGDLGFIIASQADGKSALAAQIGMNAAQKRPVLYVQMEMAPEQMGARELAKLSGMSVAEINEGAFDAFQWEQLVQAERLLADVPFYVLDMEEATVRQVRAQCLSLQRSSGLGLVIIDQLDKLKPEGKYRDRFEAYKEVTRDLKQMTKGLGIPGICLAQRTRSAQRRDDPTPHVLDADIPSIERDADWIIGLWQRANFLQMNRPDHRGGEEAKANWEQEIHKWRGVAEAITLKHRRRKAFQQCRMTFEGRIMKFSEAR